MAGIMEPRGAPPAPSAGTLAANIKRAVANMILRRDDCHPQPGVDFCEKPGESSKTVTWIIVGVVVGVLLVVTCAFLIWFHFRRKKREAREDMEDRFQRSDFGLDELPTSSRKPIPDDDKSHDGSPHGYGRRSRDPLHAGTEPKYQPGQSNGHLNPFDDGSSRAAGGNWPKREGN